MHMRVIRITVCIVQFQAPNRRRRARSGRAVKQKERKNVANITPAGLALRNSPACRTLHPRPLAWALLAGVFSSTCALAAGGHHALDDAVILDPGMCQVESWLTRSADRQRLLHAGADCRVGPLELGVSAEHSRLAGNSDTGYGLQAKWATEVLPRFNAGLSISTGWQAHVRPRYQGATASGLVSWFPSDELALHLNLGRDFV